MTLASLLLAVGECLAGGYAIPQQTAKSVGVSNAITAGVNDPSAVYYNPAALTEVKGNQILGTLNYINVQSNVQNSGSKSINRQAHNFIPTVFTNFHIPESKFTLGLGFYTPFGLSVDYDEDAFTRYAIIEGEISPYYINGAVGWRPSDIISIGAGVSYVGAFANLSRAIFLGGVGGLADASAKITGRTQTATFNLGLLLKHPNLPLKFGLTYRGRAFLDLKGAHVKFQDSATLGGAETRTKVSKGSLVLPTVVSAGINWQINPKWSLEFVYDWTKWNDLERFQFIFEDALPAAKIGPAPPLVPISVLTISTDWKNTSTLRLGTHFQPNKSWDFLAGIALDETPIPTKTLGPLVPGADTLTLNGGVGYTWRKLKFSFSYMAIFYQDRTVQNDILEAEQTVIPAQPFTPGPDKYEIFNNVVSFSLGYRF